MATRMFEETAAPRELSPSDIGKAIARMDNFAQAEILESMAAHLVYCCKGAQQMQHFYIADKIDTGSLAYEMLKDIIWKIENP